MEDLGPVRRRLRSAWKGKSWAIVGVWFLALLALVFFCLLLLAPGGVYIAEGPGSVADWVAGIGTWAIGAAAAFVAWRQGWIGERNRRDAEDRILAGAQAKLIQISQLIAMVPAGKPIGTAVDKSKGRLLATKRLLGRCELQIDETRLLSETTQRENTELLVNLEVAILAIDVALERESWRGDENESVKRALVDAGALAIKIWTQIKTDRALM